MRRIATALFLTAALLAPARAADPQIDLKISLWVPPAHPLVPSIKEWAADIEKASGGTIKSTIFPSEQLGKAFDHYDMTRDGIADVAYINPGYQPGRFPIESAADIPFTFSDAVKGSEALDAWYRKYAATEMKDTHFCFAIIHDPGTFHSRRKIVMPDDLKGVKVRPAQSQIAKLVTLLGGTNVQASAPEARDMIERGVADALTFPWGSVFLFGIDKVVKYHIDMPLYANGFTFNMNQAKYDSMSPAQKKVIDDHCNSAWAEKLAGPWADYERAGIDRLRQAPGHGWTELTPEELDAWKASAAPVEAKWAEAVRGVGIDPQTALADLKTRLKAVGAGF